jgi:methyl-accepting chemotaxis protein
MIDPVTISSVAIVYELAKYWLPILGAMYGIFKLVEWVKTSFGDITDKVHDLNANITGLVVKIEEQTHAVVEETKSHTHIVMDEVKELRSDLRALYMPLFAHQKSMEMNTVRVAQRAKKTPVPKAKKKKL